MKNRTCERFSVKPINIEIPEPGLVLQHRAHELQQANSLMRSSYVLQVKLLFGHNDKTVSFCIRQKMISNKCSLSCNPKFPVLNVDIKGSKTSFLEI